MHRPQDFAQDFAQDRPQKRCQTGAGIDVRRAAPSSHQTGSQQDCHNGAQAGSQMGTQSNPSPAPLHPGQSLREELASGTAMNPFLGIYDCLSASIAAPYSPNLFLSGFGFSASFYGLPDVGYVAWSDMVAAAWRVRQILPKHRLLVDIDDGYVDPHTACYVVRQLETMGVAMVMLEDQARPRRCGHADGKRLLPLPEYMEKLEAVLAHRENLCVLARTDASGEDIYRRVEAICSTDADVVLVDGIDSIATLRRVVACSTKPLLFNQIAGGKSPQLSLAELRACGVRLVQYSTPLLFAAQQAMSTSLEALLARDGQLAYTPDGSQVGVKDCTLLLEGNVPLPQASLIAGGVEQKVSLQPA